MINQFFLYTLVCTAGTLVHYLVFFLLMTFQVIPPLATAIGAGVGAGINYFLCRTRVFTTGYQGSWPQVGRFSATALIGMCINAVVMTLLAGTTGVWVAQLVATLLAFLVVYHLNRCWTFPISPRCIA